MKELFRPVIYALFVAGLLPSDDPKPGYCSAAITHNGRK